MNTTYCKECQFFYKENFFLLCNNPKFKHELSPIDGTIINNHCYEQRYSKKPENCGPEGKHFKQQTQQTQHQVIT